MARATWEGLLQASPDRRPFILSRSGSTGSQRYAAHWHGDGFSNYHHLHLTLGKALSLSLSGLPFNGPDVGGFGGDASGPMLLDWIKACFLFPLLRNHSCKGTRQQEPWAYSAAVLRIFRHFVLLRYKLMPYLYNLFVAQQRTGDSILRPLCYDFAESAKDALLLDDQFMVGPAIMQAPFVRAREKKRCVVLPPGKWYRADTGEWLVGEQRLSVVRRISTTPLFLRHGSLLPMRGGKVGDKGTDLRQLELFVTLSPHWDGQGSALYYCDDGQTHGYRRGHYSEFELEAAARGGSLFVKVIPRHQGFGVPELSLVTAERFARVMITWDGQSQELQGEARTAALFGPVLSYWHWTSNLLPAVV
jgi:alpha-glucosidase